MYFADRVRETTTTTGTGTVTLAGAVAQNQTFTSRVKTGDPCGYCILDANGTAWEVGQGTMATSSTLSRDTIYESSNSDSAINLSSGTHTVFLSFIADRANKQDVFGDFFIDYVVSGLTLPTTSANLTGNVGSGVAYVIGQRIVKGAQSNTYTASKDTYVDLNNVGTLTYSAVNNGAGAPALTANSIRLGYVTTNGSVITGATTSGWDSLGNPLRNLIRLPTAVCSVPYNASQSISNNTSTPVAFGSGTEEINNYGMHSTSTNNTRVTIIAAGLYKIDGVAQYGNGGGGISNNGIVYAGILKNGSLVEGTQVSQYALSPTYPATCTTALLQLSASDYVELQALVSTGSSETIIRGRFSVTRVG